MAAGMSLGGAETGGTGTAPAVFGERIAVAARALVARVPMARRMGSEEFGCLTHAFAR